MGKSPDRRLLQYGVAVLAIAVAVFLRWLIDPWVGDYLPLATLYGAVAVAVWIGGYRPALLAVVVGLLACKYLFIEPRGNVVFPGARDLIGLVIYVLSCAILIGFGEALRSGRRRLEGESGKIQESEAARRAAMQQLQMVTESMAAAVTHCSRDLAYQ